MKRMRFLLLVLVLAFAGTAVAQERLVLLEEDFESLPLGPNVDEGTAGDEVWTDTPPDGWFIDESGIPGIGDPATDGVTEWAGWAFTDKDWWVTAAGDQDRSQFDLGVGTVAVADPDEWDDAGHADSAANGWYKTYMSMAPIDLGRALAGSVQLKFDSSWRPEYDGDYHQTGVLTVSFDGGEPIQLFLWESDSGSANYKDYAVNETVTVDIDNPEGASQMVITFGMFDAGNDWWWAVDNIVVTAAPSPERAFNPYPPTGAVEVATATTLTWTPGEYVANMSPKHRLLLSDDLAAVEDGSAVIATQDPNSFDASELLDYSTTYYWRVDEANNAIGWDIGTVWTFTTEEFAYPVESIVVTTNGAIEADGGPENTINGSGLNADDQHSTLASDMFLATPADGPVNLHYEFDRVYKLHEMLIWNYNVQFELLLGFGMKGTLIEYSTDGVEWTALGEIELAQATAKPDYTANTVVDFAGAAAKYVRLTANTGWGPMGQFGLSEVRFMFIPAHARDPQPADEAAGVSVATALTWRPGRDAASHDVYLGTDADALSLAQSVASAGYLPGPLDLGTTYYWKVDEIQDTESWPGSIWSFVTEDFIVVEDFESYDDDENRIYQTWVDGYGVSSNGSTVGHLESPFAETNIVRNGMQAMPMFYGEGGAAVSEAELTLSANWTTSGVKTLSIAFAGAEGNTGQLYVKINGTKVVYDGDASDLTKAVWQAWNIDLAGVGNVTNVTSLVIGIEGGGSGVLYVDDVRLYAQAAEATMPVPADDGDANLLGLWKLDDGSGTTAADSSGNGRNGALQNGPQWIGGAQGGALQMDGVDDYAILGSISYGEGDFTAALWVKTDGWNDDAAMLSNKDWNSGSNVGWAIAGGAGNNGSWQWNISDGDSRVDFDPSVELAPITGGEWHHLCVTHDRDGMASFYHDGLRIGEADISGIVGTVDPDLPTVLGTGGAEGTTWEYWFTGAFDDVRIYDRALSYGEVAGLAGRTTPVYEAF